MLFVLTYLSLSALALTGNNTVALSREEANKHQTQLFSLSPTAKNAITAISTIAWLPALVFVVLFLVLRTKLPRVFAYRAFAGEIVIASGTWFRNMFTVSPETAFSSGYSMDGCTHILAWNMALHVFGWLLFLSPLPLLMNWFGAGFPCPPNMDSGVYGFVYTVDDGANTTQVFCGPDRNYKGEVLSTFERLTMAGFQRGNSLVWGHVATLWIVTFIVMFYLKRGNHVFNTLRSKWLLRRPKSVATSLMAVNVTSKSDKELRELFEQMFPGKIVDARLVKFCESLTKTCADLEDIEEKVKVDAQLAAEKNLSLEDDAKNPEDNKAITMFKKFMRPSLHEKRTILQKEKAMQRAEVLELCETETEKLQRTSKSTKAESLVGLMDLKKLKNLKKLTEKTLGGSVFSEIGFITFTDIRTATLASQATYSVDPRMWQMSVAPEPKDVLWYDMATKRKSTNQEQPYVIVIAAAMLFLLSFPVITILQGFLDKGTTALIEEFPFLADNFLFSAVDPFLKTLVLFIFFEILPDVFRFFSIRSGRMVDTVVHLEVQFYQILFEVVFVIYASSLGSVATNLGEHILYFINVLKDKPETKDLNFEHTFGTAVPSEFPTHYVFAAGSFFGLGSILFQLKAFKAFAIKRFLLMKSQDFAWQEACKKSTPPELNVERYVTLTVLFSIGLMIYHVFPLNSVLFLALFFLGSTCFRYRVLYVDSNLVDSGGLYYAQFELFIVAALILTQVSVCIALSSIDRNVWIMIATIPLPASCGLTLRRMRNARWKFLLMQNVDSDIEQSQECEFLYVQPQLSEARGTTQNSRDNSWSIPDVPDESLTIP